MVQRRQSRKSKSPSSSARKKKDVMGVEAENEITGSEQPLIDAAVVDEIPETSAPQENDHGEEEEDKEDGSPKEEKVVTRLLRSQASSGKSPSTIQNKMEKKKSRRQQQREELKSKNTGVGLAISVDANARDSGIRTRSKIIFDETNLPPPELESDADDAKYDHQETDRRGMDDDDDDDEAVEEVQGQAAREEILKQLESEEKRSLPSKAARKKKPRKDRVVNATMEKETEKGEELDDDFFAQLQSVREEEEAQRKQAEEVAAATAKGRHTTFVFSQDDENRSGTKHPIKIDDHIQVVVLNNPTSSNGEDAVVLNSEDFTISEEALMYSRNRLINGSDDAGGENAARFGGRGGRDKNASKKRQRDGKDDVYWKRGKTHQTFARSRMSRMVGKGKPALFFSRKAVNGEGGNS